MSSPIGIDQMPSDGHKKPCVISPSPSTVLNAVNPSVRNELATNLESKDAIHGLTANDFSGPLFAIGEERFKPLFRNAFPRKRARIDRDLFPSLILKRV